MEEKKTVQKGSLQARPGDVDPQSRPWEAEADRSGKHPNGVVYNSSS